MAEYTKRMKELREGGMALSVKLLDILSCPGCGGTLHEAGTDLLCQACSLRFPVQDGIPLLILSEAQKADQ
jgi:uncharacterized protein YbaR (Trm112 family)